MAEYETLQGILDLIDDTLMEEFSSPSPLDINPKNQDQLVFMEGLV